MASISVGIDAIVSLVTAFSVSLLYLWLLPSRRIHPRYLLAPALLVGSAILLLNLGLGRLIVTLGERFQAYGVVGGVLILTLWIRTSASAPFLKPGHEDGVRPTLTSPLRFTMARSQSTLVRIPPALASLLLVCTAVGALVLALVVSLALIPLLVGAGLVLAWLLGLLLFGWAAIEGLAALERWMENDPRFQR